MLHCSKHGRSCACKCSQGAFVMLTYLICVSETKVSIAEGKTRPALHNQRASNSVLKAALFLSKALLYSVASINHSSLHNTRIPEDKMIWLRQNKSLLCKHMCVWLIGLNCIYLNSHVTTSKQWPCSCFIELDMIKCSDVLLIVLSVIGVQL